MPSPPDASGPASEPMDGSERASPKARLLAHQLGLDLTKVVGSGPGGRIIETDVLAFARQQLGQATSSDSPAPATASEASSSLPPTPSRPPITPGSPMTAAPPSWVGREETERLLTTANIQFRRGQTAEAEKSLRQVLEARPQDAGAHELLADILLARGDFDAAQASLKTALTIQPGRPTAEAKLARAVLQRTEQQRLKSLGVAYAASDTAMVKLGGESRRSGQWAALASAVLPGLGQFLNGETAKGAVLLGVSIVGLLLLAVAPGASDVVAQLAASIAGIRHRHGAGPASPLGWFLLFLLTADWLYAVIDAALAARRASAPGASPKNDGWQV